MNLHFRENANIGVPHFRENVFSGLQSASTLFTTGAWKVRKQSMWRIDDYCRNSAIESFEVHMQHVLQTTE